jgi:carbamoylphosphate synthase large subunit
MKYYIIGIPFPDWKIHFKHNSNITYIDHINLIDSSHNYKIIPICPNDFVRYDEDKLMFFTDANFVVKLNNKGLFAEFMMENFKDYIPETIYYNVNDKQKYKSSLTTPFMIYKPVVGYGGQKVKIIEESDYIKDEGKYESTFNIVISEYVQHSTSWVGHFVVMSGILIDKIYFYSEIEINEIYKGPLHNYNVVEKLLCDDSIFMRILIKLNYSGFASIDFTITNGKICIFEINPRIGASLVFNIRYFNRFFSSLIKYYNRI